MHLRQESQNDLIDWLLENAPEVCTVHYVVVRILAVNFAAIHTTTGVRNHLPTRSVRADVSLLRPIGMYAFLV